jgi:ABC-type amino acid transport substrate-binding protein
MRRLWSRALLFLFVAAWAPAGVAQPADRLAQITARNELRVCIWPDYFAISFRNPRSGALEGIDVDLAQGLAARLRVELRFVETSFAAFMDRIEAGDCDIAMMAVGITAARQARVAFSEPYLASAIYAVTTRTHPTLRSWQDIDRPGHVVAVAAGTVMEPVMRTTLRQAELLVVGPGSTREAEVQSGRADVFMSDYPYTRRMLFVHSWARVIEPPARFGETPYGWALPRGEPRWLAEVNAFLAQIRADGTLAAAAARHDLTPILLR